jgi:hypothetical protein
MPKEKQKEAGTEKWGSMPESHAKSHPGREKPGQGGGEYYRIEVRPKSGFVAFRTQDVGAPGHIQRLAGQRDDGSWEDHAWLISKKDAYIVDDFLEADSEEVKEILETYGPAHLVEGDIFMGHPRKNISGSDTTTGARPKARMGNTNKA